MKPFRLLSFVLCVIVCGQTHASAQAMDKELTDLTTKLAAQIRENGRKKVTVLDFTDLQGGESELGKYIAEELTVNLVMNKSNFSVLDRANLKSILQEHKLTATGLIDPENAKKLGQFAGVDALILGTITTKSSTIGLTAKIITTDTAEIVGAAKSEFTPDETVKKLASQAVLREGLPTTSAVQSRAIASKDFANVRVNVEKIQILTDGWVKLDFSFQNKSATTPVAVAFYQDVCFVKPCKLRTQLTAANGQQFGCDEEDIHGIRCARFSPQNLTEIEPGGTATASVQFSSARLTSNTSSFSLQSEFMLNQNYKASDYTNYRLEENKLPPGCKVHNFVAEVPMPKQ